jgi:hypothetical protein
MAIPYTGLYFAANCNSRSSDGQYTRSSTEYINFPLPTQQWLLLAPDRPCAQHVQSTRR